MAKIFYNLDMAKAIRKIRKPVKDLVLDIKARPNYLALTVYENNIMQYDETKRGDIMEYLLLCKQLIESYGVPCEIEGAKGDPQKESLPTTR